jgi:hypothetical protein
MLACWAGWARSNMAERMSLTQQAQHAKQKLVITFLDLHCSNAVIVSSFLHPPQIFKCTYHLFKVVPLVLVHNLFGLCH